MILGRLFLKSLTDWVLFGIFLNFEESHRSLSQFSAEKESWIGILLL